MITEVFESVTMVFVSEVERCVEHRSPSNRAHIVQSNLKSEHVIVSVFESVTMRVFESEVEHRVEHRSLSNRPHIVQLNPVRTQRCNECVRIEHRVPNSRTFSWVFENKSNSNHVEHCSPPNLLRVEHIRKQVAVRVCST